jgi:hypothetical protein
VLYDSVEDIIPKSAVNSFEAAQSTGRGHSMLAGLSAVIKDHERCNDDENFQTLIEIYRRRFKQKTPSYMLDRAEYLLAVSLGVVF